MANSITNRASGDVESLRMNNGLTSIFIDVLALSASMLATTDRHKRFAIWLASRDQQVYGIGAVGFDLSDLPWTARGFQAQKDFLLRVIRTAQSKVYWHLLGYQPGREDWVQASLEQFRLLVVHCSKEGIVPEGKRRRVPSMPAFFVQCPKHRVYLHQHGCILCNEQGQK